MPVNFFTGILSTLLATPCTAPLVGTAVSFALSQNYFFTIMIFFLMGLGKSSPYILFIIRPNILSNLPKPGSWTKYVKVLIGALLLLLCSCGVQLKYGSATVYSDGIYNNEL